MRPPLSSDLFKNVPKCLTCTCTCAQQKFPSMLSGSWVILQEQLWQLWQGPDIFLQEMTALHSHQCQSASPGVRQQLHRSENKTWEQENIVKGCFLMSEWPADWPVSIWKWHPCDYLCIRGMMRALQLRRHQKELRHTEAANGRLFIWSLNIPAFIKLLRCEAPQTQLE